MAKKLNEMTSNRSSNTEMEMVQTQKVQTEVEDGNPGEGWKKRKSRVVQL